MREHVVLRPCCLPPFRTSSSWGTRADPQPEVQFVVSTRVDQPSRSRCLCSPVHSSAAIVSPPSSYDRGQSIRVPAWYRWPCPQSPPRFPASLLRPTEAAVQGRITLSVGLGLLRYGTARRDGRTRRTRRECCQIAALRVGCEIPARRRTRSCTPVLQDTLQSVTRCRLRL